MASILRHFWFLAAMATAATVCVAMIPIILSIGVCLWPLASVIRRFTKSTGVPADESHDKASLDDRHLEQVPCITGPALPPPAVMLHDNMLFDDLKEDPDCCSTGSLSTSSTSTADDLISSGLCFVFHDNDTYETDDANFNPAVTTSASRAPTTPPCLAVCLLPPTPPSQRPSMDTCSSKPVIVILPSPPMAPTTPLAAPTVRPATPTTSPATRASASTSAVIPPRAKVSCRTCRATDDSTPSFMRATASSQARFERVTRAAATKARMVF